MNAQDKQHLGPIAQQTSEPGPLIHSARIVVRETGYVATYIDDRVRFTRETELRNAIMHAYDMACAHLTQLDPAGAPEFIRSTYGPSFRQTEVTK